MEDDSLSAWAHQQELEQQQQTEETTMQKSEQINELAAALAAAQGEIENASKNSANPHFKSRYADLAEVINTVRPVFSRHGLSVSQFPGYADGLASVETIILHKSGQWMSGVASANVTKADAQGVGSAITYLRRYSLAAVTGIAQEDDDANASIGGQGKSKASANAGRDPLFDEACRATRAKISAAETVESLNELYKKTAEAVREAVKPDFTSRREALQAVAA